MTRTAMSAPGSAKIKNHAAFTWQVADLLRGDDKPSEYGKLIPPLTGIRRLACVLEPTRGKVRAVHQKWGGRKEILAARPPAPRSTTHRRSPSQPCSMMRRDWPTSFG